MHALFANAHSAQTSPKQHLPWDQKTQVVQTDIRMRPQNFGTIFYNKTQALRLSSFMLIGVSRIWSQKVIHLLHDCGEAYAKITVAFKPSNVDLKDVSKSAQLRAITDRYAVCHV